MFCKLHAFNVKMQCRKYSYNNPSVVTTLWIDGKFSSPWHLYPPCFHYSDYRKGAEQSGYSSDDSNVFSWAVTAAYRTVSAHGFISAHLIQKSNSQKGNTNAYVITHSKHWCNCITHSLTDRLSHLWDQPRVLRSSPPKKLLWLYLNWRWQSTHVFTL